MLPHPIIPNEVQRQRMAVILEFLGERVGQSRKSAHRHTHGQVLPFDMRRADMVRIGIAADLFLFRANTISRAVAPFETGGAGAIDFDQLSKINIVAKGGRDRLQISRVTVAGKLNAIS